MDNFYIFDINKNFYYIMILKAINTFNTKTIIKKTINNGWGFPTYIKWVFKSIYSIYSLIRIVSYSKLYNLICIIINLYIKIIVSPANNLSSIWKSGIW